MMWFSTTTREREKKKNPDTNQAAIEETSSKPAARRALSRIIDEMAEERTGQRSGEARRGEAATIVNSKGGNEMNEQRIPELATTNCRQAKKGGEKQAWKDRC